MDLQRSCQENDVSNDLIKSLNERLTQHGHYNPENTSRIFDNSSTLYEMKSSARIHDEHPIQITIQYAGTSIITNGIKLEPRN